MAGSIRHVVRRARSAALENPGKMPYVWRSDHSTSGLDPGVGDPGPGLLAQLPVPLSWFGASDSDRHLREGKVGRPTVRRAPRTEPIARPLFPDCDLREGGLSLFLAPFARLARRGLLPSLSWRLSIFGHGNENFG